MYLANRVIAILVPAVMLSCGLTITFGGVTPAAEPLPHGPVPVAQLDASPAAAPTADHAPERAVSPVQQEMVSAALRGAHFVPNVGQWDNEEVRYGFKTHGLDVAFRESTLTMHLRREVPVEGEAHDRPDPSDGSDLLAEASHEPDAAAEIEHLTLEVTFLGSNDVTPRGAQPRDTTFNYFVGDDESKWAGDVRSYGAIVFEEIYDGIDLHVMGSDGGVLKYEFRCAPGADHAQVQVRYDGIDGLRVDESTGDLLIETSFGTLRDGAPLVWEGDYHLPDERIAEHTIPAHFETIDNQTYTFTLLSEPDPSRSLVIDPEIEWMRYLGGRDWEEGFGVAVDGDDSALVTGRTRSTEFVGRNNSFHGGSFDAFVLKVDPSGQLEWMTYLGGSGPDDARAISVDGDGNALVTGMTRSTDFAGANNSRQGEQDAFALKVSPSGQLEWMTYLGGDGLDEGWGITADGDGSALVTGRTRSTNFTGANNSLHSVQDAFALKVSPSGQLEWMTYLGGDGFDEGWGIDVDGAGNALVTGGTDSTNFAGASNSFHGGISDAFALKVSPSGQLEWMTYLGGVGWDVGWDIAVDGDDHALVTGRTRSTDFAGANNSPYSAPITNDAFALRVTPSGELEWMTYLGGSGQDWGFGIAVDGDGDTLVTGQTRSSDFAGRNNSFHGVQDAFSLKVSPSGQLVWMTYLGGSGSDDARGITIDGAGHPLVTGLTDSTDFSERNNSFHGGDWDAFIVKLSLDPCIADWNGDGEVDINDFFAYLSDFEDGDPRADLNNDGEIDINDFFIFLQEYEEGC